MPEINQLHFSNQELVELMLKNANIHEGKWVISMLFGFAGGNFGPTESEMTPGAVIGVQKIGLQRATAETPPAMVVDASLVNPAPSKK
jgi:hypothetical protein